MHVDPLGTSAWNVVTHGQKRWVLFEPSVPKKVAKGKASRLCSQLSFQLSSQPSSQL